MHSSTAFRGRVLAEAEDNNLDGERWSSRWDRWYTCSLCEQQYHGVVMCALGWACWKTYLGRPETDWARRLAMSVIGLGLDAAGHHEDALSVQEAELAMKRRLGASEDSILAVQANLANTYQELGRPEEALLMRREVYSERLKLDGGEDESTLLAANNYAWNLEDLNRHKEAKALAHKSIPVARRILGASHLTTIRLRWIYARSLYLNDGATLDDLREAVTTLEELERITRRVFGGAYPITVEIKDDLRDARAVLRLDLRLNNEDSV